MICSIEKKIQWHKCELDVFYINETCIPGVPPHPQVGAELCGKHLFELSPAQCVFVPFVSRVLVEGLDHELHGVFKGGSVLWVGQRHAREKWEGGRLCDYHHHSKPAGSILLYIMTSAQPGTQSYKLNHLISELFGGKFASQDSFLPHQWSW